ncbi:MAG: DUF4153 domain-containing protein [Alphaproteobacteria bacterium]|nr:DUF4153 domain-containing protein [Alphaproteobacteria bacterium]MBL7099608.1 DUF4153 domain-containing protein [Alphaproteobacteria bacterium]
MTSTGTGVTPDEPPAADHNALGGARLIVGFVQGVALYLIYLAVDHHVWPSTNAYWMAPLLMVFVFVPLLFIQAVGTMRPLTLGLWAIAAAAILALLGWFDIWRQWDSTGATAPSGNGDMTFTLVAFTIVGLFIAQSLITAADAERKYVARYSAYFEVAWKLEIQLLLSAVFVGVFWGVLWLGAFLFNLINLHFIEDLIEKPWFAIPASTLAVAAALHATDVRSRLIAGVRTVAHTLLSWLLPLMVLIAVGFTLSLPFTGLQPLWATKSAAGLLLTAAGVLVILINAAFQDGDPEHNRAPVMRWSEFAAALVLVPFVLIAAYALWLRVDQYGWTTDRVLTAATTLVALAYALGYAAAALLSLGGGVWMALLARVNVAAAFLVLGILLGLFTPIADPARLSVSSQVARLRSGAVSPSHFDFNYLQAEGGRYGRQALAELATADFGKDTAKVRDLIKQALTGTYVSPPSPAKADLAKTITVYPRGSALPASFMTQDWSHSEDVVVSCLTQATAKCDAFLADIFGDRGDEVILTDGDVAYLSATVYARRPDGKWRSIGTFNSSCPGMVEALRAGKMQVVAPEFRDVAINGVRLRPSASYSLYSGCNP